MSDEMNVTPPKRVPVTQFFSGGPRSALSGALFIFEIAGLMAGIFAAVRSSAAVKILLCGLAGAAAPLILAIYVSRLSRRTGIAIHRLVTAVVLAFGPIIILLAPMFWNLSLLRDIRLFLWPTALIGIVVLNADLRRRLKRAAPTLPERVMEGSGPARKRRELIIPPGILFLLAFSVYGVLCSGVLTQPLPLTGDEPHYLIITQSLLSDGDINLYNNYANRDYLKYYPASLSPHAYQGQKEGKFLYSMHFPGLSFCLVPAYALGNLTAGLFAGAEMQRKIFIFIVRLTLSGFAAAVSVLFYLLALDVLKNRRAAVLGWLAFSFTSPMLFYAQAIYPEVPVALILLLSFRAIVVRKDLRGRTLWPLGIGLAILPWFGIKYAFHTLVFSGIATSVVYLASQKRLRKIWPILLPLGFSGGLFFLFLWNIYGTLSPVAVYYGTTPEARLPLGYFLVSGPGKAVVRLVGSFLDDRAGILPYAPIYILAAAGIFLLYRAKRGLAWTALLILGLYTAFFSINRFWSGYAPPGRHFVPILWVLALFLAAAFVIRGNLVRWITAALLGLSFFIAAAAVINPWLLYHEGLASRGSPIDPSSKLLDSLSNSFVNFRKWAPSLVGQTSIDWRPALAWIGAAVLIVFCVLRSRKTVPSRRLNAAGAGSLIVILGLSVAFLGYSFFDVHIDRGFPLGTSNCRLYFQDENSFGMEAGGFWTKGNGRTEILIAAPTRLARIDVSLSSSVPIPVEIQFEKSRIQKIIGSRGEMITLSSSPGIRLRRMTFYALKIISRGGFAPHRQDPASTDGRFLGVFVQLNFPDRRQEDPMDARFPL